MNFLALKIFKGIARERNFVKVAKLNSLSQPAVSLHLKRLENDLGVVLFERAPRKVSLTKEGELLLSRVETLLAGCEELRALANQAKNSPRGNLRIGAFYDIGIYELREHIKKFIQSYPDIHIDIQYRRSEIIHDLVLKGKIDLGFVSYPTAHSKMDLHEFGADKLVLIVSPRHPLARKCSVSLKRLQDESFVAFDKETPMREAIDAAFTEKGVRVSIRMTSDSIETIKSAVEIGLGVSIVPSLTIKEEFLKGTLKCLLINDVQLNRPRAVLALKGISIGHPAQMFLKMLEKRDEKPARKLDFQI